MKQSIKFQRVSLFRRICSIIFDAILCISIFFVIQAFAVQPIFESTTDYYQKYQEYCDTMEDTHLYIYYEEIQGVSVINSNFDKHLTDFYSGKFAQQLGYDYQTYYGLKWEKSDLNPENKDNEFLFVHTEENGQNILKENIYKVDSNGEFTNEIDELKKENVDKFYADIINKLIVEITTIDDVEELIATISAYTMLFYILAFIPAVLITYLLFPMIFKDGSTLGKKMMQMCVIDAKSGKNANKFSLFVRFTFFALLQIVLGLFTYGIIPMISIAMIFMNKNRQTIHDLISSTIVVKNSYGENDKVSDSEIIEIIYDDGVENLENSGETYEG